MFRSLFLAAALMAFTPLAANAGETPYCHQSNYKLAIAIITVITGTVVTGATRDYWHRNYEWLQKPLVAS